MERLSGKSGHTGAGEEAGAVSGTGPGTVEGLLFITHTAAGYDYIGSARAALEGGCRRVQLRMKDAAADEVLETARELKTICDGYGADLYIDDHVEIAAGIKARGVHLGKNDMAPRDARKLMRYWQIIGGTANTFGDIVALKEQGVDYIGLGPFRFTETKKNLSPILGLDGYRQILEKCRDAGITLPVLAIGGITVGDIPSIMASGVSGIALSSTILQSSDPVGETKRIIGIINSNKI